MRNSGATASVEERFAENGTQGVNDVGGGEEAGEGRGFNAGGEGEADNWEVGGAGDADALIGFGGAALGGGNVGAALEELGRQAGRDVGWLRVERHDGNGETVGRLANEDGDGMLKTGAADRQIGLLHDGGL